MCNFTIDITGHNITALIQRARTEIENVGGTFNGNESSGSFAISNPTVIGSYSVKGSEIRFDISKKPMLIPCSMIESKLRKYLFENE